MNKLLLFISLFLIFILISCSVHPKKIKKTKIIDTINSTNLKKVVVESNVAIVEMQKLPFIQNTILI